MSSFPTHDGLKLDYEDEGHGTPVLCLPGLSRNGRDFDDLAEALGRSVRLIRLTSRGRGQSEWASDISTYSVPVEAQDAMRLLDYLGIDQAVVMGTSRGGLIAMLLAGLPETKARMSGVILNDIGPELEKGGLSRIMGYLGVAPDAANYADCARSLKAQYAQEFPDISLARWEQCARRWFEESEGGLRLRYDPRLRQAVMLQAAQPSTDIWPFFEALDGLPLGLIRGMNSDLLSAGAAQRLAIRRPDMTFRTVPNRGHVPFLDEAESLEVINAVLNQVEGI